MPREDLSPAPGTARLTDDHLTDDHLTDNHGGRRAPSPPGRPRIAALDVVRGFALCGILIANVRPIANVDPSAVVGSPVGADRYGWTGLFVDQRFYPIFSLLFGVGFSLLLDSAAGRVTRPRLILLRRLAVLLGLGLVHLLLLWQGDILTVYAAAGLVVLLPSTWLPRWAVAALAAALIAIALLIAGGPYAIVPGLFLLGSALTRYGVIGRIERSTRVPVALCLLFAAGAVPAVWWQVTVPLETRAFSQAMAVAGLLVAGAYVCGLLALLRTPLRPALRAVFAPLGRMALTNYLSQTLLVLVAARVLDVPLARSDGAMFLTIGAVLAVQWLLSTLWMRRHRYGPLEWLWRWATWARRPALRRAP
ncbi:hypothetical protein Pth03_42500 [Planotetraspora thailandica]|uniref:DUF418 domain-containing protein n=1 Tax=Planotetraspora thailandica TaxID=487172 RepID=A0A8J3V6J9_9ACTN|nr:DUF418 domain-containing protein [Planotetraspora thailandica]GII55861.1 hypothetical protein Pth03_42500 [Planotetraspora thailandica]